MPDTGQVAMNTEMHDKIPALKELGRDVSSLDHRCSIIWKFIRQADSQAPPRATE